jgi:hypothetical protein
VPSNGFMRRVIFAFAVFATPCAAAAQDQPPAEEVVVTGQRTEEAIRTFVGELAVSMRGADQMGRWDRRICPGVAGLRARYAQFLIDRMAQRAFDVGLNVGEPGCTANILIVVTRDPDAIAQELFENNRDAMGWFSERGQTTLGRAALRAFVASDAPVRWWHVGRTTTNDGQEVSDTADGSAPVTFVTGGASRLRRNTRQDFGAAFIVVDANRFADVNSDFEALADYVTMVTLAQVDADADPRGLPSILNLFTDRAAPRELTDWDVAYLRGLYGAERDRDADDQQNEIARQIGQGADRQ